MSTQVYSSVIDEFITPIIGSLTPDAARQVSEARLRPEFQARIEELAEKANEGLLTTAEREEYAQIVELIDIFALLRLRASALAKRHSA